MALLKLNDTITKIDKTYRDKVWQINVPDFTSVGECEGYEKIKTIDDPTVDTFAGHSDSFYYVAERTYCQAIKNYRYYWTVSLTDKKPSDFMQVYAIKDGDYAGYYYHGNGQISSKASIQRLNTDSYDYSYEHISLPTDTSTEGVYNHKGSFNYICGKEGRGYMVTRNVESKTKTTYTGTQEDHTQTIMELNFSYDKCIYLTNGAYGIPTSTHGISTGSTDKFIYSGTIVNSPDYESQTPAMHVVTSKTLPAQYSTSDTSDSDQLVYDFLKAYGLTPKYSLSYNEYFYIPNSDNNKGTIYKYGVDYAEDESGDCGLTRTTVTNDLTLTTNQCGKIIDSDNDSYEGLSIVYFNGKYRISSQTRTVAKTADYCTSPLIMPTDDSTVIFNGHSNSFIYGDSSSSSFYDVTLTKGEKTNTTYTGSEKSVQFIGTDPCNEYIYISNIDLGVKYGLSTNTLYTPNTDISQASATNKTVSLTIDDSFKEHINGGSVENLEGHSSNFTYFVPLHDESGNALSSGSIYQASRSQTNDGGQEFTPIPLEATQVYTVSGGDVSTGYITKTGKVITSLKGTNGKDKIINYRKD